MYGAPTLRDSGACRTRYSRYPAAAAVTVAADAFALTAAFSSAYYVHVFTALFVFGYGGAFSHHIVKVMAVLVPLWLINFAARGLYSEEMVQHGTRVTTRVVNATSIATVVSLAVIGLLGDRLLPPGWIVLTWCIAIILVLAGRMTVRGFARFYRRRRPWRLLLIGASQQGVHAVEQLSRRHDICVVGFLDDYLPLGVEVLNGKRVLARSESALSVAREHQVDELFVVQGALPDESFDRLMREAYTVPELPPVRFIPNTTGELVVRLQPAYRGGVPINVAELRRITGGNAIAKELFDRIVAVLVLVCTSPLFLAAWLWSVAHKRSLLSGAWLVGHRGRRFRRWSLLAWWKDDPAVHKTLILSDKSQGGLSVRLLRKLPRFLNVAKGDLSLVGPRPIDDEELYLYSEWAGVLLSMKPGLVGPWLLHGESLLSPEEELQADLAYVHDYTLMADIVILWRSARQLSRVLWAGARQGQ